MTEVAPKPWPLRVVDVARIGRRLGGPLEIAPLLALALTGCGVLPTQPSVSAGEATGWVCAPGHANHRALIGVDLLTNTGSQALHLSAVKLDRATNLQLVGARLVDPSAPGIGSQPYVDGPSAVEPSSLKAGKRRYLVYALQVDPNTDYGTALGSTVTLQTEQGATTTVHTCFALGLSNHRSCSGDDDPTVPDLSSEMDGPCTGTGGGG